MFHLIGQLVFGLIVGVIAKVIMPGQDPGGFFITAIIGMVGSLLGTGIGRVIWRNKEYHAHWIMAILGAIIVLAVYRFFR
jgi:uncharacterized membrane protein YeaQ/YmgE (transglycosylase-associated protein family)